MDPTRLDQQTIARIASSPVYLERGGELQCFGCKYETHSGGWSGCKKKLVRKRGLFTGAIQCGDVKCPFKVLKREAIASADEREP
jgi:hypothetical protein